MAEIVTQKIQVADKEISLEVGRLAPQTNGSVLARVGDTMVLATVVASRVESNLDFFPLSVEFIERLYAGGRISSSRFVKREGRPSENAVLSGRLIDRTVRPLFPKCFKNEVQLIVTVLSVDSENDPTVLGVIAASAALAVSDIPWDGPIGCTRIGWNEEYLVNPVEEVMNSSKMDLVVSGTGTQIAMVEAGMKEVPEEIVLSALDEASVYNGAVCKGISELVVKVGKQKFEYTSLKIEEAKRLRIEAVIQPKIEEMVALAAAKKLSKEDAQGELKKEVAHHFEKEELAEGQEPVTKAEIGYLVESLFKKTIRANTLATKKRADGRGYTEVRELEVGLSILPRVHGSAIFRRGLTQTLTSVTLGSPSLEQLLEGPTGEKTKRYMHHYFFPPYSVGEVGRMGTPGRREIGHGALAERALIPVIPAQEVFPYAIRVVNEITSSNGSSSMASVCGSTLALMDAGVPITAPVAGIAMGLMLNEETGEYGVLSDIQGLEDATGDMDFKVAGSSKGITALQMDIKLSGIPNNILKEALAQAREARMFILDFMLKEISTSRPTLSKYAPRVIIVKIDPAQIGLVIGGGGKTINQIISQCNVAIDIDDDGSVMISGTEDEGMAKAKAWVESLTKEVKVGEVYEGVVKRIMGFGAFVEILPGKEGLVHISKLAPTRVEQVEDVVQIGDDVTVKVDEIDNENRINLTMDLAGTWEKESGGGGTNGDRGGRDRNRFDRRDNNRRDNNRRGGRY